MERTLEEALTEKLAQMEMWSDRAEAEASRMRKVLETVRAGKFEVERLERTQEFTHAAFGPAAFQQPLPRPGTLGYLVDQTMREAARRRKGRALSNEEIVKLVQAQDPTANEGSILGYLYNNQNDPRRRRDMKKLGTGYWVVDAKQIAHEATNDEVQDTIVAACKGTSEPSTKPVKPYAPSSVKAYALRVLQDRAPAQLGIDEIAEGVEQLGMKVKNRSALSFLYMDIKRPKCPFKLVAPGKWQAKRVYTEPENGNGNGTGYVRKKKIVRTPEQRAHLSKVMKASHRKRAAERKKNEQELEKIEKRELVKA